MAVTTPNAQAFLYLSASPHVVAVTTGDAVVLPWFVTITAIALWAPAPACTAGFATTGACAAVTEDCMCYRWSLASDVNISNAHTYHWALVPAPEVFAIGLNVAARYASVVHTWPPDVIQPRSVLKLLCDLQEPARTPPPCSVRLNVTYATLAPIGRIPLSYAPQIALLVTGAAIATIICVIYALRHWHFVHIAKKSS
jgi:hypothetical protein